MVEPKKTYYVSVVHNLIQDIPDDSTEFTVLATDDELSILRDKMSTHIKMTNTHSNVPLSPLNQLTTIIQRIFLMTK